MGIVLAVKKNGVICIASDSMYVTGGSTKLTGDQVVNSEKIIEWGSSYIGITDHPVWPLVLKNYVAQSKQKPSLKSRGEIFDELLKMHQLLKDKYYLVNEVDEDDSFESSRFESLIINSYGIFKTYHLRSIQQFINFAAIGSGSSYALGALHALYDRLDSAEEIAKAALNVVTEIDDSSGLPGIFYSVKSE
jgi:ATP-dependent protease HslVU (ClpYQ) peptidase subunit